MKFLPTDFPNIFTVRSDKDGFYLVPDGFKARALGIKYLGRKLKTYRLLEKRYISKPEAIGIGRSHTRMFIEQSNMNSRRCRNKQLKEEKYLERKRAA